MADNVAITAGAGTTIATDDVGGVHYQISKNAFGALDTATLVTATVGLPENMLQVGNTSVNAFPAGFQRTSDEPRQMFYDPFDAALDTTNRWVSPTSAGGGVAAAVAAGNLTLGSGTTINGYSYLTSQPSFTPSIPAWIANSWAISIEFAVGTNAVRFWGCGIVGGTPSSTNPLGATGDGYGFELDIAGVLQAVVYAGGVRTVVSSLAALQPADNALHRYIIFYRTDRIYWYIDGLGSAQLAATSNFQSPQIQTLPLLALAVAHSSAPAASRVITCAGLAMADTGKNVTQQSDGVFPWRKQTILKASTAAVAADSPSVVAMHPTSPLPAGANILGKVGIDQTTPGTTNLVQIGAHGAVSTANSSSANLGAGAVFTGTSEDVSGYSNIAVSVFSSHVSATDGLSIQQSSDGSNWDFMEVFSIPAATGKNFTFGVHAKFYRLVYTNGATLTTSLRIQTLFFKSNKKSSSQRAQDARTNDNDFEEALSYLMGFNGTSWDRLRAKAASTAAVAGDISLVVALSPNSPVALPTLTKGTQGSTGVTTQDLKDAGRVLWSAATAIAGVTAVTAEALLTMIPQRDGTAAATATSHTVTAAKRLRIISMSAGLISTGASVLSGRISLRIGAAGAATATSPIIHTLAIPSGAALAQAGGSMTISFPDGIEVSGSQQIGVSQVCSAVSGTVWVTLAGFEY